MDIDKVIILADVILAKFIKSQVHAKVGINRGEFRVLQYIYNLGGNVKNRYLLRKCRNFRSPANTHLNVDMVINKLIYCGYVERNNGDIIITSKGLLLCAKFSEFARNYFSSEGGFNYYYTEDSY